MLEIELLERFKREGFPHETILRLVSVLMWIQVAVEIPDLLTTIVSLEDSELSIVAKEAERLLGFLLSNHATDPASLSVSKLQSFVDENRKGSLSINGLFGDRERIMAFVDEKCRMLSKAEGKVKEGYSNRVGESPSPNGSHNQSESSTHLNPSAPPFVPLISVDGGTEDERCLYLTFSKGHPCTSSEIIGFFTEMCNNIGGWRQNPQVVKTVYIHKGEDGMALFGKVVFCNPYLPGFILGKQKEIKFVLNGKTLWCKRFVRRNSRNHRKDHNQGESSTQVSMTQGGVGFGGTWYGNSWGGQYPGIMSRSGSSLLVWPHGVRTGVVPGIGWPAGQFFQPVVQRVMGHVGPPPPPPQGIGIPGGSVMIGISPGGYYNGTMSRSWNFR